MTTTTDIQLDQQTRDELHPPCEAGNADGNACSDPATHIGRWAPCSCGRDILLICTEHATFVIANAPRAHLWSCTGCGDATVLLSVEGI